MEIMNCKDMHAIQNMHMRFPVML